MDIIVFIFIDINLVQVTYLSCALDKYYMTDKEKRELIQQTAIRFKAERKEKDFAFLYRELKHVIGSCATKYMRTSADVEEQVQEAFVTAYSIIDKFDPERGMFVWWLWRICVNQSCVALRTMYKTNQIEELEEFGSFSHELLETPDYEYYEKPEETDQKKMELLNELAKTLKKSQGREVYMLYLKGMRTEEISKELYMPLREARALLNKGKSQMKVRLNKVISMRRAGKEIDMNKMISRKSYFYDPVAGVMREEE